MQEEGTQGGTQGAGGRALSPDDRLHVIGRLTQDGWLARAQATERAGIIGVPPRTPPPPHPPAPHPAHAQTPPPRTSTLARVTAASVPFRAPWVGQQLHMLGAPQSFNFGGTARKRDTMLTVPSGGSAHLFKSKQTAW